MLKCGHAAMEKGTKQRNNKKLKNKIYNVVFKFLFSKNRDSNNRKMQDNKNP